MAFNPPNPWEVQVTCGAPWWAGAMPKAEILGSAHLATRGSSEVVKTAAFGLGSQSCPYTSPKARDPKYFTFGHQGAL